MCVNKGEQFYHVAQYTDATIIGQSALSFLLFPNRSVPLQSSIKITSLWAGYASVFCIAVHSGHQTLGLRHRYIQHRRGVLVSALPKFFIANMKKATGAFQRLDVLAYLVIGITCCPFFVLHFHYCLPSFQLYVTTVVIPVTTSVSS